MNYLTKASELPVISGCGWNISPTTVNMNTALCVCVCVWVYLLRACYPHLLPLKTLYSCTRMQLELGLSAFFD